MKKWFPWVIVIALVCVLGFFGYRWYSRRAALRATAQDLRRNIASAKVERRDLEVVVTGKGTVQANLKKNVQPGVAGKVGQILVKEGDLVGAGAPLLVLYNASVTYQADQARLDLALAAQTLGNMTGPAGTKPSAELALKQAELDLSTAQDKVDDLTVESPISGEVWTLAVKLGDSVKAGTVLATVGDTSSFTVAARVRQADLTKLKTGVAVSIAPGGDVPLIGGVITSIGKEGTTGSKGVEFPITVTVSNPHENLRAGMAVNVNYMASDGEEYSIPGTVAALDRRDVKAEVDGTVSSILVSGGATVQKDQVMVKLDNSSLQVSLDKSRNAVEQARQNLSSYESSIEQQKLKVEQAQVSANDKAESAAKLVVKSPIDGKVVSISVQTGDDVTAGQTVLAVSQVSPLTVVIPVDELDISNVAVGQPATVEIDALPDEKLDGTVQKIAQEGTVQQGITNYNVTIQLKSGTPRLGMSATANIAIAQKKDVLTIPVEAVKWNQGQAYVNQMQDGQAVQKRIKVGVQGDLYAEVASGLEEGETVLVGNIPAGLKETGLGGLHMPGQVPRMNIPAGQQNRPR